MREGRTCRLIKIKMYRRNRNKRRIDIKILLRLLVLLCIITIMLTVTSSLFKLEKIEIEGNVSIPDSEILNSVNHHLGENIFMIKPALINEEIKQSVPVKEVKVKLKLPGTMVISVEERKIAAALSYLGGFVLIDSNGVVVRIGPELKGLMVPVITGLEISRAEKAKPLVISGDQSLLEKLKEVMKFLSPMNAELSEIHIEKNREGVSFFIYTLDGYQVYFEETGIEERKFAMLREVLEDLRKNGRGKGLIDLSQDMPVFRPY
ncbi:cell division protein FtsQ [Thermosediminibacter litoriperuensis]|uniref:Cell division protein FtsQ n=2 Tax=Thermosediminibacter litoriperuensis TaxID=291989 RepID=A0A5S5AUR0_9FIRM|nr:cell division protein FtsQ [Thermosediminibacter litoriperuensis]